jgi:hypothetical protein
MFLYLDSPTHEAPGKNGLIKIWKLSGTANVCSYLDSPAHEAPGKDGLIRI